MRKRLISFDWALKSILRNKANSGILNGLLSELLGRNVVVQQILESEGNSGREDGKVNKLDLKAQIDEGEIAIFEMQVGKQRDFFHRILFGTSNAVIEQLDKGDKYEKIKKVYSIDIVYFDLGRGDDYIYHGTTDFRGVHDNKSLLLSEKEMRFLPQYIRESGLAGDLFPEYYLIYPDKFDERIRNKFDEWVYSFKTSTVESEFTAAGIQELGEALDVAKMTESERIAYADYLKYERVRGSEITTALDDGRVEGEAKGRAEGLAAGKAEGLAEGLAEGKAEGLAEGEAKGKAVGKAEGLAEGGANKAKEVAKNMKNKGMDANTIAELTGLSVDDVLTL